MTENTNRLLKMLLGPICFALCLLILPRNLFSREACIAIGTLVWMGVWWVTLPVHTGVTGFVPIIVNALFCIVPMDGVLAKYANETIFLLIGADLVSQSWTVTGLDRRISLKSLYLIGPSLTQQVIVWFLVSTALSMFLPNMVVTAMLTPIALAMLRYVGEEDCKTSVIASVILVCIVWGSGIGGMGTPLGGAMNLVAIDYLEELIGQEFLYSSWFVRMMPLLIAIILIDLVCILLIKPKNKNLEGTREYFKDLYKQLPVMNLDEKISLSLFVVVMILCFTRNFYADLLPGLKPAYAFLIAGILTFMIPRARQKDAAGKRLPSSGMRLNEWKQATANLGWGLYFMCGGGMAIGGMLTSTGAVDSFADIIHTFNLTGGFGTFLIFSLFTVILSEISNNTSAAAISIPIVISICSGLGLNPLPYIYTVIAAFNCAYALPTTIRAIPVGFGLEPGYMLKKGVLLTFSSALVAAAVGYSLTILWPAFSSF